MGVLDWLLLALIAGAAVCAVRRLRHHGSGDCCGDCTRCGEHRQDSTCRRSRKER